MPVHEKTNLTPFAADLGVCQDKDGRDLVVAVLKATFQFSTDGRVVAAGKDRMVPVFTQDAYFGDPARSSLKHASDIVPTKPGTDVALNGNAYGRNRTSVEAGFKVGPLEKIILVSGPRYWLGGWPATVVGPVAFEKMPIRYENSFGGSYRTESGETFFERNPAGMGFAKAAREKVPLPSLEYRIARFKSVKDRPAPASLGFIPPGWPQRAARAGTFDAAWSKTRRPLVPLDFDERFYNAVPADQVLLPKLAGGEQLVLRNVHPRAEILVLEVPRLRFAATFQVKERSDEVPMVADTLLIEPDEERFAISYRSSCVVGDDLKFVKRVIFKPIGH